MTSYKTRTIKAAKELCYSEEVIAKLRAAKTDAEIERIMVQARQST